MNAIYNAVFAEDIFDVIPSKMNLVNFSLVYTIIVVALLFFGAVDYHIFGIYNFFLTMKIKFSFSWGNINKLEI